MCGKTMMVVTTQPPNINLCMLGCLSVLDLGRKSYGVPDAFDLEA